ncbi:MAG: hypothetical protein R6U13_09050 [Desulfatiglandaceae bacterium]
MVKLKSREQSLLWLESELSEESAIIDRGFELLDTCVSKLDSIGKERGNKLSGKLFTIGAITLAKSTHLLLGCFSLALDGLSQESGALMRPLIETYELLVYLRQDPKRVEEAINENLPSAGNIAKEISGKFFDIRKHLNEHASHFNYKVESIRHLVNLEKKVRINAFPSHSMSVFNRNLNTINAFQTILLAEAGYWLEITKNNDKFDNVLESYCRKSNTIFPSPTKPNPRCT